MERLDADLCAGTPTGIAEFLTTRFLQSPYADDTAYTFTAEPGDAADPYGQLSVTLQRHRLARGAQAAWDLGAGLSAGELAAQMDAFEHTAAELADYEITVTVNAAVSGAAFSYTQRYERRVVCRVAYTVAGQVYCRRAGTLEFYPLSDPQMQGPPALTAQTLPDRGQVEANGEPSAAAADSRYVNLEKGGGKLTMVHRCRAALCSRRGETLVEVLTAFALLLLFLSGFAASLHTAAALQQRAADTRAAADACITALRPPSGAPPAVPDGSAAYVFRGPDGAAAFTVEDVRRETVTAPEEAEGDRRYTFHRFAVPAQ